jgi:hypothetical protein
MHDLDGALTRGAIRGLGFGERQSVATSFDHLMRRNAEKAMTSTSQYRAPDSQDLSAAQSGETPIIGVPRTGGVMLELMPSDMDPPTPNAGLPQVHGHTSM